MGAALGSSLGRGLTKKVLTALATEKKDLDASSITGTSTCNNNNKENRRHTQQPPRIVPASPLSISSTSQRKDGVQTTWCQSCGRSLCSPGKKGRRESRSANKNTRKKSATCTKRRMLSPPKHVKKMKSRLFQLRLPGCIVAALVVSGHCNTSRIESNAMSTMKHAGQTHGSLTGTRRRPFSFRFKKKQWRGLHAVPRVVMESTVSLRYI
mmetsp:Transcript_15934/g.45832  ORF Transcript_15934/g.45832 Transcript_15934/m.45832 type:complete len:210 (+) Transcript_15934:439-1068(+)